MRSLLLTLLAFAAGCTGCVSVPQSEHGATMRVTFADHGLCSATAVGPSTILIATHCLTAPLKTASSIMAHEVSRVDDKHDHSLVRLNIRFASWAKFGESARQGDEIHYYGNALGFNDLLRRGYVANCDGTACMVDVEGAPGDSGSGVFDASGRIIGVISQMYQANNFQFRMMVLCPLTFTQAQLEAATA